MLLYLELIMPEYRPLKYAIYMRSTYILTYMNIFIYNMVTSDVNYRVIVKKPNVIMHHSVCVRWRVCIEELP